ncbi:MAG: ComEC family competence protein [Candidatus Omnitrophica bacterium]|nr:ComEC family competence protein [Candidatus Omnitrophota bacterium]
MSFEILILFSFIIGILIYKNFSPLLIFSLFPLFFLPKFNKKFLFYFFLFFFLGYISNYKYKNNLNWGTDFSNISEIEGEIVSLKEKPFETNIIVDVKRISKGEKYYNWNGKIIIKNKEKIKFLPGQKIKIKDIINISEISPPKNPFEFDYKKFMNRNGIFFQVKSNNVEIIKSEINLKLFFSYIRERIENRIEKYMRFNPDSCELVKLLTIGNDDTPDFLRRVGVKTGIYHLFVISGIHIIFIIFLLKVIFIPFQKINNVKPFAFPLIILVFLWFYDFLCGFKVPITRAVVMVSFYLISEILGKEIDPIKSLIIACIFLLFLNPFYIYSLSFLLSFLSTAGILITYKKINFLKKKNFIINSFVATISAQIFILPILFYNFSYFYPIGILSNLIFTPIVGLITIISFISLIIPILFYPLSFITTIFLKSLILISNFSHKISFYFPLFFVFVYYFFLLFLISSIKKNIKFIISFLFIIFCLLYSFKKSSNEEIIFFSFKSPVILLCSDNKAVLVIPESIKNQDYYQEILYKVSKNKRIEIEKIILFGDKFCDNLFFASIFRKSQIFIDKSINYPDFLKGRIKVIKFSDEKIKVNKAELIFKDENLIIKYDNIKILILLNGNIKDSLIGEKYFLVYLVKPKKRIDEDIMNNLNSIFLVFQKDSKKFEKFKKLCQNYYLEKGDLILNLKSKILDYWIEK